MNRAVIAFLCVTSALAGRAQAQSATYVTGGVSFELPTRTSTTPASAANLTIKGFNLGVGFPLGKADLEFNGVWHSAETDVDRSGEPNVFETRVVNRDIPILATIRFQPACQARWCVEVLGGFGINFSRRSFLRIGNCGTASQPVTPCAQTSVGLPPSNKEEPTGFFGMAVTMAVAHRLEIGPSVRVWYVNRYRDQTAATSLTNRWVPDNERLELGMTAVWYLHSR